MSLVCKDFEWQRFMAEGFCFCVSLGIFIGLRFIQPSLKFFVPAIEEYCQPYRISDKVVSVLQTWIWYKLAHIVCYYELIRVIESRKKFLNSLCVVCFLMANLIFDLPMHLFPGYSQWMYSAFWAGETLVAVLLEGVVIGLPPGDIGFLAFNGLLLFLGYGLPAAFILLLNPLLFALLDGSFGTLLVYTYLFPLLTFVLELLLRAVVKLAMPRARPFIAQAHWLLYGFRFGFLLRVNYFEAEFYYVLLLLCIENVSLSWLNQFRWFGSSMEPPFFVAGWVAAFLLAYYGRYNPVPELLGSLVRPTSCVLEYDWRLPYLIPTSNYVEYQDAAALSPSNIQGLVSALVVWALYLPTRKYRVDEITLARVPYYCMGIYLFFVGMTACGQLSPS